MGALQGLIDEGAPENEGGPGDGGAPGDKEVSGDRGATTRERRERPLLIVHTGAMKGKTTAAFGMALRAWAAGLPVIVHQFVKSGRWRVGEESALRALGEVHARTGQGAPVEWYALGQGRTGARIRLDAPDPAAQAARAWADVRARLARGGPAFHLLDEFTYPLTWGWVDVEEVVDTLVRRPGFQHVIVTGRDAHPRLVAVADLVAESVVVRHPLESGQPGQRGIEW